MCIVRDLGDTNVSPTFSHSHLRHRVLHEALLPSSPNRFGAGISTATRLSTEGIPHPRTGIPLLRAEVISHVAHLELYPSITPT